MSKQYPNLPGVNVNVLDGQLTTATSRSANSILIIAKANSGKTVPKGPVYISNEKDLYTNFGGFFHKGLVNPIAAQWLVAYKAGVNNIYLMALRGETEKDQYINLYKDLFETVADLSISHIVLDGLYADEEIEELQLTEFNFSEGAEIQLPTYHVYTGTMAPTELAPNAEGYSLTIKLPDSESSVLTAPNVVLTAPEGPLDVVALNGQLQEALTLYGFDFEGNIKLTSKNVVEMSFTLPVTLEGTEILEAMGIAPETVTEKITGSPTVLLSTFAELISQEIGGVIAYIGTSTPADYTITGISNHVAKLEKVNTQISPYLQIVAGPEVGTMIPGSLRKQWLSGVVHYAVLVNSLLPQYAATNQPLLNAMQLRYSLSPRQLNALTGNKMVTFQMKNNQVRVVDAVTTAPDLSIGTDTIKSDFTRLSTLRIMNHIVRRMRYATEPFIGQPNEFYNYNGMNTAIRAELDDAIERGIIQDATYSIRLGNSLDTAEIDLTILPQFELRLINITVGLSRPELFGTQSVAK